jgi:hypothetical protein
MIHTAALLEANSQDKATKSRAYAAYVCDWANTRPRQAGAEVQREISPWVPVEKSVAVGLAGVLIVKVFSKGTLNHEKFF